MVFLTDNGPAFPRYNAGLRDLKGSVYEGGIRVPGYVRWPGQFPAGIEVDRVAAHIDIVPTLLEACDIPAGAEPPLDGRSLLPLLRGDGRRLAGPDALLPVAPGRRAGAGPGLRRALAVVQAAPPRGPRRERPSRRSSSTTSSTIRSSKHDLAASRPELVAAMYRDYLAWFRDVSGTRGFGPIRIEVGGTRENPTLLTRQDRRGQGTEARAEGVGRWELEIVRAGRYEVTVHVPESKPGSRLHLTIGEVSLEQADPGRMEADRLLPRRHAQGRPRHGSKHGPSVTGAGPGCST